MLKGYLWGADLQTRTKTTMGIMVITKARAKVEAALSQNQDTTMATITTKMVMATTTTVVPAIIVGKRVTGKEIATRG